MTSKFYQPIEKGVELIAEGTTAYHAEYNGLYPRLARELTDNSLCGLKHIDTIPQIITHITGTRRSPWTNAMRIKGQWLHEVGLAARVRAKWRIRPPPCRETLLAEQVKIGDVTPLLLVTLGGAVLSVFILICEQVTNTVATPPLPLHHFTPPPSDIISYQRGQQCTGDSSGVTNDHG
ncbi:hypothetical protein EVAR_35885_1 [Eumeta japonica]|uniref:Uncharacterized protein n=1 Tax=Eumeta variegata TaxID=151549 RepID=A0A4C1WUQ6_EUMVA|nr:hypothetical protein EVAR_35885_1 [Eumeta japonica]